MKRRTHEFVKENTKLIVFLILSVSWSFPGLYASVVNKYIKNVTDSERAKSKAKLHSFGKAVLIAQKFTELKRLWVGASVWLH